MILSDSPLKLVAHHDFVQSTRFALTTRFIHIAELLNVCVLVYYDEVWSAHAAWPPIGRDKTTTVYILMDPDPT
jgi:hypothetical protein